MILLERVFYRVRMEPLEPLYRAVLAELARLETPHDRVRMNVQLGAVVVEGVTSNWGMRTMLETALGRAGLRPEVHARYPEFEFVIYADPERRARA